MEERKEIIRKMVSIGMPTTKALEIAGVPRSTYYFKGKGTKKGKAASTHTVFKGEMVPNDAIVTSINEILSQEFIDYGYIRTTVVLKQLGYMINKKKVYRIMKEQHLLFPKRKGINKGKKYVQYTSPACTHPFEVMEIDIKYIYIHGIKSNAYLITILDVFTRVALVWSLNMNMKAQRVNELIDQLMNQWFIPYDIDPFNTQIKIRTDNGSQFIAHTFRERLMRSGIDNEYIRPGTPQQNGHIESFHSTVSNLVCNKYHFEDFESAKLTLSRFFDVYNNKRIMASILYLTPMDFLNLWNLGYIEVKKNKVKTKYFFRESRPEKQASLSSEVDFRFYKDNNNSNTFFTTS